VEQFLRRGEVKEKYLSSNSTPSYGELSAQSSAVNALRSLNSEAEDLKLHACGVIW